MSTNLATILVGLGYDLSALQKGAPEAFRMINEQTLGMSAQMKRNAREGAEAFRSIDEMIGIHINRPMTRLLVETFPQFGKALSDILGGVAFGAVAFAGVELFERISRGIEQAKEAQEEFGKAMQHTQDVIGDMAAEHARAMKEIELQTEALAGGPGAKLQLAKFNVDTSAMQEAKKNVDAITKALDDQAKAAEKAHGFWVRLETALFAVPVDFWSKLLGGAQETTDKLKEADTLMTLIMRQRSGDPMKGLQDSLKEVTAQAKSTFTELYALQIANAALATKLAGEKSKFYYTGPGAGPVAEPDTTALSAGQEKANALAQVLIGLNAQITAIKDAIDKAMGKDKIEGMTSSLEAQKKAAADLASLYKEMGGAMAQLHPPDAFQKIEQDIAAIREKAITDFAAITAGVKAGLVPQAVLDQATAAYERMTKTSEEGAGQMATYHTSILDKLRQELELTENLTQAWGLLAKPLPGGKFTGTTAPGISAAPTVIPAFGAGGTAAAQFETFSKDQAAQITLLKQAFADAMTPVEKFNLTERELSLILKDANGNFIDGAAGAAAYAAAMQKAKDALVEADDHLHKMQEDLQKLLERSTEASAGVEAFFKQLQIDASENGKFTFDVLTQALHGFNDEVAKAITTGKENWKEYFRSLDEMAIKFFLTKSENAAFQGIAGTGIGKSIGGLLGLTPKIDMTGVSSGPSPSQTPLPPGVFGIPNDAFAAAGKALPTIGATGQDAAVSANTAGLTANTSALTALTARLGLSSLGAGGGFGGFGGSGAPGDLGSADSLFPEIPGFATGTDSAPGGFAWVGEQGPELLNLPAGSSVTPSGSARGGDTHVYQDFRGAVVSEELMRKADFQRAMSAARPGIIGEAVANAMEIQRRTPKR